MSKRLDWRRAKTWRAAVRREPSSNQTLNTAAAAERAWLRTLRMRDRIALETMAGKGRRAHG
jgi:hypothetical protein